MGWILELCKSVLRNLKAWIQMADNLQSIIRDLSECKMNISSYANEVQATREIVNRIEIYGSDGAIRAITVISLKIDKLDDKLGQVVTVHGERLSRLEGIVLNGHNKIQK